MTIALHLPYNSIFRFQSKRMDDQRCSLADPLLPPTAAENVKYRPEPAAAACNGAACKPGPVQVAAKEELLGRITGAQAIRLT